MLTKGIDRCMGFTDEMHEKVWDETEVGTSPNQTFSHT
jgi:hypothetical protein